MNGQFSQQPEGESVVVDGNDASSHPPLNLKEAFEEISGSAKQDSLRTSSIVPPGSVTISHEEERKNFQVRVSGDLARGFWKLLGVVVIVHLMTTVIFSWHHIGKAEPGDEDKRTERIEKAIANVNDTAKTLYTFLTPLATAVTGYYFATGGISSSSTDSRSKENS